MIDIKMNTIEDDILDHIISIYIYKINRESDKKLKNIFFTKKEILETSRYSDIQVMNCLNRLKKKGFIYNRRYKEWHLWEDKLDLVITEMIKRRLKIGIF